MVYGAALLDQIVLYPDQYELPQHREQHPRRRLLQRSQRLVLVGHASRAAARAAARACAARQRRTRRRRTRRRRRRCRRVLSPSLAAIGGVVRSITCLPRTAFAAPTAFAGGCLDRRELLRPGHARSEHAETRRWPATPPITAGALCAATAARPAHPGVLVHVHGECGVRDRARVRADRRLDRGSVGEQRVERGDAALGAVPAATRLLEAPGRRIAHGRRLLRASTS
mmetsp:Transcript_5219/g.11699  ORF Transcript_5219/g.11699 Transcript_5219/m.11699 type:complete len:227 (+) Transcript_5219:274-954(+)